MWCKNIYELLIYQEKWKMKNKKRIPNIYETPSISMKPSFYNDKKIETGSNGICVWKQECSFRNDIISLHMCIVKCKLQNQCASKLSWQPSLKRLKRLINLFFDMKINASYFQKRNDSFSVIEEKIILQSFRVFKSSQVSFKVLTMISTSKAKSF